MALIVVDFMLCRDGSPGERHKSIIQACGGEVPLIHSGNNINNSSNQNNSNSNPQGSVAGQWRLCASHLGYNLLLASLNREIVSWWALATCRVSGPKP